MKGLYIHSREFVVSALMREGAPGVNRKRYMLVVVHPEFCTGVPQDGTD
jgi:hypothetical protein